METPLFCENLASLGGGSDKGFEKEQLDHVMADFLHFKNGLGHVMAELGKPEGSVECVHNAYR